MFDRILYRAREAIRSSFYYMTQHSQNAMFNRDLSLIEIENSILQGEILERQHDPKTGESKYRLRGPTYGGEIEVLFKFAPDGRLAIITVYPI